MFLANQSDTLNFVKNRLLTGGSIGVFADLNFICYITAGNKSNKKLWSYILAKWSNKDPWPYKVDGKRLK